MSNRGLTQQQVETLFRQLSPQQQAAFPQLDPAQKQHLLQRLAQQQQQYQQQQHRYRVLRTEIDSVADDPLDPVKRYHDGIFVEVDGKLGRGKLFHVTGDIIAARGMRYEEKIGWIPGQSGRLHRTTPIGWLLKTDFDSGRVSSVLRALPTPTKQQGVNFWKPSSVPGVIEIIWTKENGDPYGPNEPHRPVMKCNEWTSLAVSTLRSQGVLRDAVISFMIANETTAEVRLLQRPLFRIVQVFSLAISSIERHRATLAGGFSQYQPHLAAR